MNKPLKVFITYSHKNTVEKDELITRLALLKREGLISIWHDNEILPGDKWRDAIFSNLADSDLLLYLVSAYSLASELCDIELRRSVYGNTRVIPIILENCDWFNHQLSGFEVLPYEGMPISEWQSESEGWQNVLDGIQRTILEIQAQTNLPSGISQEKVQAEQVFQRGNSLVMLGEMDRAIRAYSDTLELNPHHTGATANRILVNTLKKQEQRLADITKPLVLTEGKTDVQYIQTALALLGEQELLNSLKLKSVGNEGKKGDEHGGKGGLKRVLSFYKVDSSLISRPILLLYDWDANKRSEQIDKLWVKSIQHNDKNTKVSKGIENLFDTNLFQDRFYDEKVKNRGDGGKYISRELNKQKFCQWICENRRNPADFEEFKGVVEILKKFVKCLNHF